MVYCSSGGLSLGDGSLYRAMYYYTEVMGALWEF